MAKNHLLGLCLVLLSLVACGLLVSLDFELQFGFCEPRVKEGSQVVIARSKPKEIE
jgi:hypothetical protein